MDDIAHIYRAHRIISFARIHLYKFQVADITHKVNGITRLRAYIKRAQLYFFQLGERNSNLYLITTFLHNSLIYLL